MGHKVMLNVNKTNFKKNDVLIYDGKEWFAVTKEELFKELTEKQDEAISRYDRKFCKLEKDFIDFKSEVSEQIQELARIIEKLIK